jgi:hypothetical protein
VRKSTTSQSSTAKQKAAHNYVGLVRNPVRLSPTFCSKKMGDKLGQGDYPFEPQEHMLRMLKIKRVEDKISMNTVMYHIIDLR